MAEFGNLGVDPRDCRLDIAFVLGDSTVPDSVEWSTAERDCSCVWLDFIDVQYNPCVNTDAVEQDWMKPVPTVCDLTGGIVEAIPTDNVAKVTPCGDIVVVSDKEVTEVDISYCPVNAAKAVTLDSMRPVATVCTMKNTGISVTPTGSTVSVKPKNSVVVVSSRENKVVRR